MTAFEMAPLTEYTFSQEGNAAKITEEGWATPEPQFTWTVEKLATITLPLPKSPGAYVLRIRCAPYLAPDSVRFQRLVILINGKEAGSARLVADTLLDCEVPWSVLTQSEQLHIALQLPDAVQPSAIGRGEDHRLLGLAVKSLSLLRVAPRAEQEVPSPVESDDRPLSELMLEFESLGENCEFGLVQRRCGAEPLGLFRFSSAPYARLLAGLRAHFKGLGAPHNIEVQVSQTGREFMVFDKRFGFLYHAWVSVGEEEPEEIFKRESRRLPLLIRKLNEELTSGDKIFVYHGMDPLSLEQARALSKAMRAFGPTTLLWVELADDHNPPGAVVEIEPGLLKGHMDRFAPGENAHDLSLDCWIDMCRNAHRLWRKPQ
jgi:hypothetical protein